MLANNIVEISQQIINDPLSSAVIKKKLCWCASHCCRNPKLPGVSSLIPVLSTALFQNLIEIYPDVLWALANLSEFYKSELVSCNILPTIVKLSKIDLKTVQQPSLRIIGNLLGGSDQSADAVVGLGVIRCLSRALESRNKDIRVEAMWGISNLCAGKHAQDVVSKGVFKQVVEIAVTDSIEIQREAVWSLSNAVLSCDKEAIELLVADGMLSAICYLLGTVDLRAKRILLKTIGRVLEIGNDVCPNSYVCVLENNGGKDTIERLAECNNNKIAAKALKILEEYFDDTTKDVEMIPTNTYIF